MPQTLLSLFLDLRPASVQRVQDILARWRDDQEQTPDLYSEMRTRLPGLHFMSLTIFSDSHYDPILAIEANTDDTAELFWHQLTTAYGDMLQTVMRCCKRPPGHAGILFDAAVQPGAMDSVAAFFQHVPQRPVAGHQGHRGLDRTRIEQETALFTDTQLLLSRRGPARPATAVGLHAELRAALLPGHPWLDQPSPARVSLRERLGDGIALALALALAMFTLSLPGVLLSALNTMVLLTLIACIGLTATLILWGGLSQDIKNEGVQAKAEFTLMLRHAVPLLVSPGAQLAAAALFAGFYLAISSAVVAFGFKLWSNDTLGAAYVDGLRTMALGLASLGATVPMLLLWLRRIEAADPVQDEAQISQDEVASFERAEDQITQNHMASVVLVKPGILRAVVIRAGLRGLGLLLRVLATDGYLGSMRTIHFAHWTFTGNGSRLVFFSNFDGSWESYLDDFIAKAHGGLSLAWGSCIGFPRCSFLVLQGASHGRQFKAWARRSMAPASFWFSAYPQDTVDHIERKTALADGLRRPTLTQQEAAAWVRTL